MNKLIVFFSIALITSVLTPGVSAQKNELFSTYTFSDIDMSSVKTVEVNTINSSLTVNGHATSEAVVEMYVSPNSSESRRRKWSDEEIKQYLEENQTIEVKVDGKKLLITVKPKTKGVEHINVSFKITVPKQIDTHLQTVNGKITIDNLSGTQKFQTVNGSLNIQNVSGKIIGSTVNGNVTVTNSNDDINLSTINGNISENDCEGKVKLSTVNGKVKRK